MKLTRRTLTWILPPLCALLVYTIAYFGSSHLIREVIEPEGYEWVTRDFSHDWQVKFFKPVLGLESAWRDGDFSWSVDRAQ